MHKFTKTLLDGFQGKLVGFESPDGQFSVKADKAGIRMEGKFEIVTMDDLQDFAKLMDDVWRERMKLSPKLVSTLAGH